MRARRLTLSALAGLSMIERRRSVVSLFAHTKNEKGGPIRWIVDFLSPCGSSSLLTHDFAAKV